MLFSVAKLLIVLASANRYIYNLNYHMRNKIAYNAPVKRTHFSIGCSTNKLYVTRVTDWYNEACRVMPNSDLE